MDGLVRTITGTIIRAGIFKGMRNTSVAVTVTLGIIASVLYVVAG